VHQNINTSTALISAWKDITLYVTFCKYSDTFKVCWDLQWQFYCRFSEECATKAILKKKLIDNSDLSSIRCAFSGAACKVYGVKFRLAVEQYM